MKSLLYISIFPMLFFSANTMLGQKNNNLPALNNGLTTSKSVKQDSPKRTVINFLKWYKANEKRLDKIKILKGGLADTTTFYSVDFKETETYLKELKKCNFLSDTFLYDLRKRFTGLDSLLKKNPQNDGPVMGYDFDLIMKAQDYMDVWENLDSSKIISGSIIKNKAIIKVQFTGNYKTIYCLTKYGDKWLLDRLDNAFADK